MPQNSNSNNSNSNSKNNSIIVIVIVIVIVTVLAGHATALSQKPSPRAHRPFLTGSIFFCGMLLHIEGSSFPKEGDPHINPKPYIIPDTSPLYGV